MRYYSTQRPIVPGSYPKPEGNAVTEILNFEKKAFCEEIGQEVWGYVCYERPLSREQQETYELATGDAEWKTWAKSEAGTILSAPSVHQSGRLLEAFIEILEGAGVPEQSTALEQFWEILRGTSFVNEDFDAEDNHGWAGCPPERTVATYLSLELERQGSTAEDLDYLKRCARQFREQFLPTGGCGTNAEFFSRVMEYLDKKYNLSKYLFQGQRAVAIFLREEYQDEPNVTLCKYKEKLHGFTYHFAFMDATGFMTMFLNFSPAFFIIDSIADALMTRAFCVMKDEPGNVKVDFSFPTEVLDCLETLTKSRYWRESRKILWSGIKNIIRDAILSESPFLNEPARTNILSSSGVVERKKVLEATLKRLAERYGEKDAEESRPEGV